MVKLFAHLNGLNKADTYIYFEYQNRKHLTGKNAMEFLFLITKHPLIARNTGKTMTFSENSRNFSTTEYETWCDAIVLLNYR